MNIPENVLFTKDHEWARIEGKAAYIGISDYAQGALGDITFVDLPKIGAELKQSEYCATVESVKAASDVYAPLSGKVISVNEEAAKNPALINQSPFEKGYFFVMEFSSETEKENLMDLAAYKKYCEGLSNH